MYSFGYVTQKSTLVGEFSNFLVEKPVAIIFTLKANHSIILHFFFVFILGQNKVLIIVKRRVHVTFKQEAG